MADKEVFAKIVVYDGRQVVDKKFAPYRPLLISHYIGLAFDASFDTSNNSTEQASWSN